MITWGLVGIAAAFVTGPHGFYITRFLLGAAEAGFFPGAIYYLSQWYPVSHRSRVVAVFSVAVPLSVFVGAPVSGALLELDGSRDCGAGSGCSSWSRCRPSGWGSSRWRSCPTGRTTRAG